MTGQCIIRGCEELGVCLDDKNYTKWALDLPDLNVVIGKELPRELWYCQAHAKDYLFPIIDSIYGNTVSDILADCKAEGIL